MFKKLALKFLESKFVKGKLTAAGGIALVASIVNSQYGVDIGPDLTLVVNGVFGAVALAGAVRKVYQAQK